MPVVAPEFSVGDRPQADRFLPRDRTADRFVFDCLEVRILGLARGDELGRAQQAADMVGVKRRYAHAPILQTQRARRSVIELAVDRSGLPAWL
jgi:hypothetical protein